MKRKGFTLVELLGVITVLAIIALIAVPTILGIIEKSRKGSLQNSGYGLVEAGTLYNAQFQNNKTIRFDIKDNEITSKEENKLTYKGTVREGSVLINNKGEVTVCINDGKYAAYKNFKDNKVTVVDNKTCNIPENSNIVYLDNEATIDIDIENLLQRIESLENTVLEQSEKIEELENNQINKTEMTTQITNLNNTHNADINLLNGMINQNKNNIDTIKSIFNGPGVTSNLTVNMPGTVYLNELYKNNFVANIGLQIEFTDGTSPNIREVIATLPEEFRPSHDCYVLGLAYNSNEWQTITLVIRSNGQIIQNFSGGAVYSYLMIYTTYPVQPTF